jgi:serine/threonine protein kinase
MQTSNLDWQIDLADVRRLRLLNESPERKIYTCTWRHDTVCMKVVPSAIGATELSVLSKCVHPKVCQFLGGCTLNDTTYMLFEYMTNGNLKEYLRVKDLSLFEKLGLALDIAIGLGYLASRRPHIVLHRDIKPDNIFINQYGGAKLGDFGSSKLVESASTVPRLHTGEIGTYRWTAPEILQSSPYDFTSDIYSFGMILRYIWSGVEPYSSYKKQVQVIFAKISQNPDTFDDLLLPGCSMDASRVIKALVEECTDFDPLQRPSTGLIIERLRTLRETTEIPKIAPAQHVGPS